MCLSRAIYLIFYDLRLQIWKYSVQNCNQMNLKIQEDGTWRYRVEVDQVYRLGRSEGVALATRFPGTDKNLMRRGPKSGVQHPTEQSELHTREQNSNWHQNRSWNESWQWNKCWSVKHRLIIYQLALIRVPRITAGTGTEWRSVRHWERAQHNRAGDD